MKATALQEYKAFLALRPPDVNDPLAADARRRTAAP
jgi:hypothetical protein